MSSYAVSRDRKEAKVCRECRVAMWMAFGMTRAVLRFSMAMISLKSRTSWRYAYEGQLRIRILIVPATTPLTLVTQPKRFV